jgi:hypothetical protein
MKKHNNKDSIYSRMKKGETCVLRTGKGHVCIANKHLSISINDNVKNGRLNLFSWMICPKCKQEFERELRLKTSGKKVNEGYYKECKK